MNIGYRLSRDGTKKFHILEWGRGPGERMATGIFTFMKPKDQIQKNHNSQALRILEIKKSELLLEIQAHGTGFLLEHKIKKNFLDFYEDFVNKNKRKTNRSLPCSLSAFKKFLRNEMQLKGDDPVFISAINITENLCERFRQFLLDTLDGETPGDYFMRFKRVMSNATKQGYFKENPAEEVKAKAHPSYIKDTLTIDEFLVLLRSHCPNHEVKKAAVCSMYTGFRWCDVEPLQWWQIKEETIVLRKQSKTGVPLEVPLHPVVNAILGDEKMANERIFSLPTQDGANKVLKKWVRDAGIDKHITWHCLRHTVSHLLQDAGVDVETVAAFLGHKNAKYVLATYKKRVTAANIVSAANKLPLPSTS